MVVLCRAASPWCHLVDSTHRVRPSRPAAIKHRRRSGNQSHERQSGGRCATHTSLDAVSGARVLQAADAARSHAECARVTRLGDPSRACPSHITAKLNQVTSSPTKYPPDTLMFKERQIVVVAAGTL
ncbi:hypothetical protein CBL_05714 [Carabus blaptoides fortunei]